MGKQTRSCLIREKTATFSALIDAAEAIKTVVDRPLEDPIDIIGSLEDLQMRLEKRIFDHLPSTIQEADLQRVFFNNTIKDIANTIREIDHNEGMQFISSLNRMIQFYRQKYKNFDSAGSEYTYH